MTNKKLNKIFMWWNLSGNIGNENKLSVSQQRVINCAAETICKSLYEYWVKWWSRKWKCMMVNNDLNRRESLLIEVKTLGILKMSNAICAWNCKNSKKGMLLYS